MRRKKKLKTKPNFSGLKVVNSELAYEKDLNGNFKLKPFVLGTIDKYGQAVYKRILDRKTKKYKRRYLNDYTNLTDKLKNDLFDFWDNSKNVKKFRAYLIDESIKKTAIKNRS